MSSKKHESDMTHTLDLIRNFWPDFPICRENFERPTSEFVIRFYKNVVAEINEKLSFITNEEVMENQDMDQEIYLYCQVAKIYRKLNYSAFSLTDLYDPQPKRIRPFLKTAIHFVIFVNNDLDEIAKIPSEICKKFTESRDLKSLKQQALQNTAENSENLARSRDINTELKTKLELIKTTKYEKMLKDKAEREKIYLEKTIEKKHLESEVDNLDYELNHSQEQESELQKRLVTEEDFQNLKKRENFFELEYNRISSDDYDVDGDFSKESEMCEYFEECAKNLEALNFNSIDVHTLREMKEERQLHQTKQKKYKNEDRSLIDIAQAKIEVINKKKQREEESRKLYSQLHAKAIEVEAEERKIYEEKTDQFAARFQEFQRLQTEIMHVQGENTKIDEDRRVFVEEAAKHRQKILTADRNAAAKFEHTLLHLNNLK